MIMAQALAKAGKFKILRLDMQYSEKEDCYVGRVWLSPYNTNNVFKYDIKETGEVKIVNNEEM